MNWYKKAQQNIPPAPDDEQKYDKWFDRYYHNIGHYDELDSYDAGHSKGISLWVTNGVGRNFQRKDFDIDNKWDDEEDTEYYDIAHGSYWPQEILSKGFHGRYDHRIKIVSITRPHDRIMLKSTPIESIPGSLIRTLQNNYGKDVKIMALPERIYL